jgi:hypothetical protein
LDGLTLAARCLVVMNGPDDTLRGSFVLISDL